MLLHVMFPIVKNVMLILEQHVKLVNQDFLKNFGNVKFKTLVVFKIVTNVVLLVNWYVIIVNMNLVLIQPTKLA